MSSSPAASRAHAPVSYDHESKQGHAGKQSNRGPRFWRPAPKVDAVSQSVAPPAPHAVAPPLPVIRLGKSRDVPSGSGTESHAAPVGGAVGPSSGLVITVGTSGTVSSAREVTIAAAKPQSKKRQHSEAKSDAVAVPAVAAPAPKSERVMALLHPLLLTCPRITPPSMQAARKDRA